MAAKKLNEGRLKKVDCPNCKATLAFRRPFSPFLDSSGFECYSLTCDNCRTRIAAIIDPTDGKVLLSTP